MYVYSFLEVIKSPMFIALVMSIVCDVLIGNIKAFVKNDYHSDVGIKGSLKHVALVSFILMVMPHVILFVDIGTDVLHVIWYFTFQYVMSIIENLGEMGIKIPKKFLKLFRLFDEEGHQKEEDMNG